MKFVKLIPTEKPDSDVYVNPASIIKLVPFINDEKGCVVRLIDGSEFSVTATAEEIATALKG